MLSIILNMVLYLIAVFILDILWHTVDTMSPVYHTILCIVSVLVSIMYLIKLFTLI